MKYKITMTIKLEQDYEIEADDEEQANELAFDRFEKKWLENAVFEEAYVGKIEKADY